MKALGTNVLVRFLVKDDEQKAKAAYRKFKQTELELFELFIKGDLLDEWLDEINR